MQKVYHKDLTGDDLHWPKPHATTHMAHGSDRVPVFEPVDALPAVAALGQAFFLNTDEYPYVRKTVGWKRIMLDGDVAGWVAGPAASTDNAVARWDGAGGNVIQDSGIIIDDTDNVTGVGALACGAVTSSGGISAVSYAIGINTLDAAEWAVLDGITLNQTVDHASVTIATTNPLAGGGDISSNRTFSVGGLASMGTSNYVVGVNNAGNAWEYKNVVGTANEIDIAHVANQIQIGLPNDVTIAGTLTVVGDIGLTGTRVAQGWFTGLEITNMPTIGGTSISDVFLRLDQTTVQTVINGAPIFSGGLAAGSTSQLTIDTSGNLETSGSGRFDGHLLNDFDVAVIELINCQLNDPTGIVALSWTSRTLIADDGNDTILDWHTVGMADFNSTIIRTSGNIYIDSDSSVLGFGLNCPTPDATIGFDNNSLNIVANAVTGTDDLTITAGNLALTDAGYLTLGNDTALRAPISLVAAPVTYVGNIMLKHPTGVGNTAFNYITSWDSTENGSGTTGRLWWFGNGSTGNSDFSIYNDVSGADILFYTNGTGVVRTITTAFGINTASPVSKLSMGSTHDDVTSRMAFYEIAAGTYFYGIGMAHPSNYGVGIWGGTQAATPTNSNMDLFVEVGGNVGIQVITPTAQLHIDQPSASGAKPVLRLDQGDIDDTFIDFIGTSAPDGSRSISSDTTEDSTKFGAIRVEINGVTKWIRIYDNES